MLKSWLTPLVVAALGLAMSQQLADADEWDARVDAIMASFDTDDLIGQMSQIAIYGLVDSEANLRRGQEYRDAVGTIQNITMEENGGHPMIFGLDSVHGAALVSGAVKFGQEINGAASFNPDLVYAMGQFTARNTLAAGIPWSFVPILDKSSNPLWARTYETFGEDPYTISVMADAVVRGMQSVNGSAACLKHFIAYSDTPTGHDKDTLTDFDLINYFAPQFKAGFDAGALTTMENYISVNGVPTIANPKLMTDLLRNDFAFDGVSVSDYAEINQLTDFHRTARSEDEATRQSLERTTLDMSMIASDDSFINGTKLLTERNPDILSRIQESARRVVKLKVKLGLYDNAMPGEEYIDLVGDDDEIAAALEMARESIVLLQNNGSTLPLPTNASIFLTGHTADRIAYQCGGWSVTGKQTTSTYDVSDDAFPHGISVKDGLEAIAGNDTITYFNGLHWNGSYSDADLAEAKELAAKAEYTIAVIGEEPYHEKTGDLDDLALPAGQIEYVKEIASTGTKVILVLFEGRPRLLQGLPETAMAEIIYGEVNPSGRLPITYPKDEANVAIPYNHRVTTQCGDYEACDMQWEYGHGLSYTTFEYSDLTLSTTNVTSSSDSINVSVTVTNAGSMAGKETVMLFLTQPYRSFNVPDVKMLKKFTKIALDAGASQTVSFTLTAEDWGVYYPQIGQGFKKVAEDADYVIAIKPETNCDVHNTTAAANPLCATFTLATGEYPFNTLAPLV
ncbi:family 3 glycoside hydrolase [Phytophthora sojae]|uniref:beta-glucosidase n=1 Tax=Phytophthora sojae (strain P6497) TaxID=1094619 RepID=G4YS69_PHYSP|nr:family 3 glycoside hydrolase [Phytophthora sojae]EGZ24770.1 family 3 glycoside hydrolase [Phytophthora sojae]|eukprot:XP_009520058.1 family 3 glycoside hydrolase [Phytophthora sojae]